MNQSAYMYIDTLCVINTDINLKGKKKFCVKLYNTMDREKQVGSEIDWFTNHTVFLYHVFCYQAYSKQDKP